jgi:hypothetical protein
VTALFGLVVLLHPDNEVAIAAAVILLPATLIGIWRYSRAPQPEANVTTSSAPGESAVPADLRHIGTQLE